MGEAVYNVFFHPLRAFPGPLLWRAFRLPYVRRAVQGRLATDMVAMHENYGPVVRIAPDELAFAHASVWRDVMSGKQELQKWAEYYQVQDRQPVNIMFAPADEHAVMRRAMSVGFSDRVLREMEPTIQKGTGLFMRRLRDQCKLPGAEGEVDISAWYNFATFDLIGEVVMGESYGCLENGDYHPWVAPIFQVTYISGIVAALSHYPWLKSTLLRLFRPIISRKILDHQAYTRASLTKRMEIKRTDLVQAMLDTKGDTVSKTALNSHLTCVEFSMQAVETDVMVNLVGERHG